jgi:NAD(P)-dependent dehydrogenase (short-subunit alcohol dehydrogenase family)
MTRRIAITGAATGIGAAAARLFKARGDHVTAFDIARPSAHADVFIQVDMADPAAIDAALARAGAPFHALCNVAGLPPRDGLAEQILRVNFLGLRRFTLGLLDRLEEGGAIVSVASRAGCRWRDNLAQVKALAALDPADLPAFVAAERIDPVRAYDLSKEAVIVWTMANTAMLLDRGLRANTVSPAAIETRILKDFIAAFGDRATRGMDLVRRPGTAEEVAAVIAFLGAPESGWLRGADIPVDGGLAAMMTAEALAL